MIVAIVQARLESTRLSGKVLLPIAGKPMLWWVLRRLARCSVLDQIMVATTNRPADDRVLEYVRAIGIQRPEISVFRGPSEDVLERYCRATRFMGLADDDVIVRVTADCPLIDPAVVTAVMEEYRTGHWDVVTSRPGYPDGMDAEGFSVAMLRRWAKQATDPAEREHVTQHAYDHPDRYRIGRLETGADMQHLKLSVDTLEELYAVEYFAQMGVDVTLDQILGTFQSWRPRGKRLEEE